MMNFMHSVTGRIPHAVCLLLLLCAVATAQTPAQTEAGGNQQQPGVMLDVIFTDEANHAVADVRREDVRLTEDGTEQTVTLFEREQRPVSYGLLIDTSGSMRAILDQVIATARAVVGANRDGDKAFVMHYVDSDTIEVDTGLTGDRGALEAALDDLFIEGGLTATLDALHRALDFTARSRTGEKPLPRPETPRHALVLITDGEDRGSRKSNPETLVARLRETDVQVFVIGLTELVKEVRNRKEAVGLLTRLAQETGGRAFFPKSFAEMPEVLKELTENLHTQYLVGYKPTNEKRDGSFRKVQVTVAAAKGKRKAVTRSGYVPRY